MSYSKLIFIRKCNPIYEDYTKKYSTLRFYSETIINLADRLGIKEIEIPYFDETYLSDAGKGKEFKAREWYNSEESSNCDDMPTIRFRDSARKRGISVKIYNINNTDVDATDSLVTISFMTECESILSDQFNNIIDPIVQKSKGFIYLASDNEYSGYAYKKNNDVWSCLEFIGELMPKSFREKIKCIIMTESNSENLRFKLVDKFNCPVFYMPMIIDKRDLRFDDFVDFKDKENSVVMLKNLNTFREYTQFFDSIKDHGVVFESSMPAIQKKYRPFCDTYGLTYKFARFWKMSDFENKIRPYKIFVGMSTIGSSRFTSKILEGTNAGCITICPKINLENVGFSKDEYPVCNKVLSSSGIGEVKTADAYGTCECSNSFAEISREFLEFDESEYNDRIMSQKYFILDYFTEGSEVINECLFKIVEYLSSL